MVNDTTHRADDGDDRTETQGETDELALRVGEAGAAEIRWTSPQL
jgi:hypothetical protein